MHIEREQPVAAALMETHHIAVRKLCAVLECRNCLLFPGESTISEQFLLQSVQAVLLFSTI